MAKIVVPKKCCLDENASPNLCMICGSSPSDPEYSAHMTATYSSPLAILGIVFGLPGILILYFVLRKSHPVRIKQCRDCGLIRKRLPMWLGLNWVLCLLLLFGGGSVVSSSSPSNSLGAIGGLMMMAAFVYPVLYWAFYSRRYNVSCQGITADAVTLGLPNSNYAANFSSHPLPNESTVQMTCQHCRALIPSDSNFCSGCGQAI